MFFLSLIWLSYILNKLRRPPSCAGHGTLGGLVMHITALLGRIYQYAGHKVVNHSGTVEGYGAQIAFLSERNVGIVMLANSKTKQFWNILPTFLEHEPGLKSSK